MALKNFYKNDIILFEYDDEDKAVKERCMAFYIGWYMIHLNDVRKWGLC